MSNDASELRRGLLVEEFKQLHETIRQREIAMNQIVTITTSGVTTLLAAAAAFVFNLHELRTPAFCYLLLIPQPFIIFAMRMMTSQRDDLYKMGFYLLVFFEDRDDDVAGWNLNLERFRVIVKGESQDAASLIVWSFFLTSTILFIASLIDFNAFIPVNMLVIFPTGCILLYYSTQFHRDRRYMIAAWREVLSQAKAISAARPNAISQAKVETANP